MNLVTAATFQDGVFKPDECLNLRPHARVRLVIESLEEGKKDLEPKPAWDALERLWQQSTIDSQGECLNREQLHERR